VCTPDSYREITTGNALWPSWFFVAFVTRINHQKDERSRSRLLQN
jgi:hypothetical protein